MRLGAALLKWAGVVGVAVAVSACSARGSAVVVQPNQADFRSYTTLAISVDSAVADDVRQETNAIAVRTLERVKSGARFQALRLANTTEADAGTLVVRATVTKMKKVGAGTRFLVGALAGRANVTLDVKLIDAATGKVLGSHTVRGESGGTGFSGGTNDALDKAAEAMARLVG